jgi:anion-transporting  ArsA/GET3 family ATPase
LILPAESGYAYCVSEMNAKPMRLLLFSGKGGVGKSSVAAATGIRLAQMGYRTMVMSVDPAHSLADAFDLQTALFHGNTADPYQIFPGLWIQEVNIQKEIKRWWREISAYVTAVLNYGYSGRRGGGNRDSARDGRTERHDVRQPVPP